MEAPYLIISDLQIPFEAEKALEFCIYVKRHFKVKEVLCAGDELDFYHGGRWPRSPDGHYSAVGELAAAKEKLKRWYAAFPKCRLAISNHGIRWVRKAAAAEIPSQLLRAYEDIIEAPPGWKWQDEWIIKDSKMTWRLIHGTGYSGPNGARNATIDAGISTVIGHLHSHAAIHYISPRGGKRLWSMNCGSLIDTEAYAFEYGRESRLQPCLGVSLVTNGGTTPIWLPYDL